MKKKKNEYKPQRYKKYIRNALSVLGTCLLAYLFIVVGYSVAKPFGEVGEPKIDLNLSSQIDENLLEEIKAENTESYKAYWLKDSEYESLESLAGYINVLGREYNAVVVPLKIEGGKLNFSPSYDEAILAEVGSDLSLTDIYNTIKERGYTPIAAINTMQDNIYPETSKNAGFLLKDTKKLWLDTQDENGKPWLNPASTETKQYLSAITGEIAQAGFKKIICTNVEYPSFSKAALEDIGGIVVETDRYLDLVDNVNNLNQVAESKKGELWLEISAYNLLCGKEEVFFKPIMLDSDKYVLKINLSDFDKEIEINGKNVNFSNMTASEKIKTICGLVENSLYKSSYVPEITASNTNMLQKQEIIDTLKELGHESFVFRQ